MKLIEKKCPNCGAGLSFEDTAKSCRCEYCKREFEIERNVSGEEFFLKAISTPLKIFSYFAIGHLIFVLIGVILFVGLVAFGIYTANKHFKDSVNESTLEEIVEDNPLIADAKDLTPNDLESIDNKAYFVISSLAEGVKDTNHHFGRDGDPTREKVFVAYKDKENKLVPIYNVTYYDHFHPTNRYTIYIPVIYNDVEKDVIFSLADGKVSAPIYYFAEDQSTYYYGYNTLDEAIAGVIDPLKKEYEVTEK